MISGDLRFFQRLSLVLLGLTLAAFSTTYFLPVATQRFIGPPILHIHGLLFFAWSVTFVLQSRSIGRSRRWHRGIGLAAISLATLMIVSGLFAIGSSIADWSARGTALPGQAISIIAFTGLMMFAMFFTCAIAMTGNKIAHPRLMALATLAIMQAVSGRLMLTLALGGNPELLRPGLLPPVEVTRVLVPHLAFDLMVLAVMLWHDRKVCRRFQPVTLVGGGVLLMVHATRHLFADSALWAQIARLLEAL